MKKLSYQECVRIYEREKQRLQNMGLPYKEYEQQIRELAKRLGI